MTLKVPFKCEVQIRDLEKNYTGSVTFSPEPGDTETFYFLFLNPYVARDAEIGIFVDKEMQNVFSEGVGKSVDLVNRQTGKPIVGFDFTHITDTETMGVTFVLVQIISEAVYRAECKLGKVFTRLSSKVIPTCSFEQIYEMPFSPETEIYAQAFIKRFGMY